MSAMNAEFFDAIEQIEKEKGIPRGYMQEKIQQALLTAFKRDNPDCEDNVEVIMDENKKTISMFVLKTIVEESEYVNDATQILLDEAHHYDKKAGIGDTVRIPVETKKFGRIAAQAAKQVIIQGIREAERGIIYDEFTSKEHEILTGVVTRIDPRTGAVSIKISSNSEFTEAMLSATERIKGEELTEGDRIKVYVVEVRKSTRGPQVLISRTHPGLVKRLFELEVPEIFDGTVEIRSIARRWPSTPPIPRSIRSARASVPAADVWRASSTSSAARRSISSSTARIPSSTSPRRSPRRRFSPLRCSRKATAAA